MKKILIYLSIILISFSCISSRLFASESTSSAVSDEEVNEALKKRIEQEREKDFDKVKGAVEENLSSTLYGYFGIISKIENETYFLETSGQQEQKKTKIASSAAVFKITENQVKKEIDPQKIEATNFIITMGPKNADNIISGKRVIVLETPPATNPRKVISGTVKEVDEKQVKIENENQETKITIGTNTNIKIKDSEKKAVEDIQINDFLSAIVSENEETVFAVFIVPGTANPQAEENQITDEELEDLETTTSADLQSPASTTSAE